MIAPEIRERLLTYLREDISSGDVTAAITPIEECIASVTSNEKCVLAGIEEVSFLMNDAGLEARAMKHDGEAARKGEKVLEIRGSNRKILTLERVCLNVLGRMSGVATLCSRALEIAEGRATIAVTRKTVPGFQLLDKKAAQAAGCWTHRRNLSEMILLKDNHLRFFSGALDAAKKAKAAGKKFEIEVETEGQALEAIAAQPDMVLLDNFSPRDAKKTVAKLRKRGFSGQIELSGGITLKNLKRYTNLGADIISMGELTKSARIVDYSLDIEKVKK